MIRMAKLGKQSSLCQGLICSITQRRIRKYKLAQCLAYQSITYHRITYIMTAYDPVCTMAIAHLQIGIISNHRLF